MRKAQRYVSHELTHFVGAGRDSEEDQYQLLVHILRAGVLRRPGQSNIVHTVDAEGRPGKTITEFFEITGSKRLSSNEKYLGAVVCFADIPVDDLGLHMGKYSRFGLSFSRTFLLGKGASPLLYVSRSSSTNVRNPLANDPYNHQAKLQELAEQRRNRGSWENFARCDLFDEAERALSKIVKRATDEAESKPYDPDELETNSEYRILNEFLQRHLFPFMKFFDAELPEDHPDNYYMEREWRVVGPMEFRLEDVERVLLPREFSPRLREDLPRYQAQVQFTD